MLNEEAPFFLELLATNIGCCNLSKAYAVVTDIFITIWSLCNPVDSGEGFTRNTSKKGRPEDTDTGNLAW